MPYTYGLRSVSANMMRGGFDEKITNANTANDWPHVSLREQGRTWELLFTARSS
jgi:hypothetical protein